MLYQKHFDYKEAVFLNKNFLFLSKKFSHMNF